MYLSGFATSWNQLFILRVLMGIFNAIAGPCSYSLITDWIPSEGRTLAYAIYASGVQIGGPMSHMNEGIIDWLGWRAAFQFSALMGFVTLAICILIFDEPERGRFDINNSVVVNPD